MVSLDSVRHPRRLGVYLALPLIMATANVYSQSEEGSKPAKAPERSDIGALLEKVPPELRERMTQELERVRAEAERIRRESMEKGERIQAEATERARQIRRDAEAQLERVRDEINRTREAAEARRERENHGEKVETPRNPTTFSREVRVEVRKENGGKPEVKVFENGKPLPSDAPITVHVVPEGEKSGIGPDLSKLPAEKRALIEKARDEFKKAQENLKKAAENLAKAEGREKANIMIFRADGPGAVFMAKPGAEGVPQIQLRGIPADRLPHLPLPPGARGDRIPLPPVPPVRGVELEKRVSKAEKALDEILLELKKIREEADEDDDDDDEKEHHSKEGKGRKRRS
ncbi:MAG: hypothetical protein RJA81_791 [Planctomycetota bacterium]